ncbi:MAG: hypothetical protein IPO32_17550 [Crocinitomicaceae bacterium]|nr:hypothetical protein [Crocinitomicaceae bacterium]
MIPLFEKEGAMKKVKIGQADTLVADAKKFLEVMIKAYKEKGITMYTPEGEKVNGKR